MAGHLNHLDIFMKMLEVIEKDLDTKPRDITSADRDKVHTIIEKIEGTLVVNTYEQEVIMSGDTFTNNTNSVIAARGAIASGVINIRQKQGVDTAEAILFLKQSLEAPEIPDEKRVEALELLGEICSKAPEKSTSKTVMKSLGSSLKSVLEDIGSMSDVLNKVWPVISKLWL